MIGRGLMMGGSGKHRPTTVTVYPDGPLVVRGTVEIADADGTVIEHGGGAVALCRCGKSAVKPFCDGNHKLARLRLS